LDWGHKFLTFLKDVVKEARFHSGKSVPVWRVTFRPGAGVSVAKLDEDGIEDVVGGEDRVGFLPTWYWDEVHATIAYIDHEAEDCHAKASDAPHRT
jgi:RAT1-interacting protein